MAVNKSRVIYIGLIITSALVVFGVFNYSKVTNYRKAVDEMVINPVDLSTIADGAYRGSYDQVYVAAEVEVVVSNSVIQSINLISHKEGRGEKAESVIDEVLEQQTLTVDTVTGATSSSKVILKAIELALTGAAE